MLFTCDCHEHTSVGVSQAIHRRFTRVTCAQFARDLAQTPRVSWFQTGTSDL